MILGSVVWSIRDSQDCPKSLNHYKAAFTAVGGTHRTGEAVEGIVLIVVAAATDSIFTAEDVIRTVVAVLLLRAIGLARLCRRLLVGS